MKLWWMLLQKEFRLMQSFLLAHGFILALFGTAGVYLANRYHSGIPSAVAFAVMVWHLVYLLIYTLKSVSKEKQSAPIMLHSPQSGWFLLSAKYAAGLIALSLSFYLIMGIWLWIVHLDYANKVFEAGVRIPFIFRMESVLSKHWFSFGLIFIIRALFLAVLGGMVYYIRDVFKYALRGWRWILFPIIFVFSLRLVFHFTLTSFYNTLFGWGLLDISKESLAVSPDHEISIPIQLIWGQLALGGIVYFILLTSLLFYFTSWLLDRKVEV
jgi:hypothetical protein